MEIEEYLVESLEYIDNNYADFLKENKDMCCEFNSGVSIKDGNRDLLELQITATINPRNYTIRVVERDVNYYIQVYDKGE
jgi:hypothetical protein